MQQHQKNQHRCGCSDDKLAELGRGAVKAAAVVGGGMIAIGLLRHRKFVIRTALLGAAAMLVRSYVSGDAATGKARAVKDMGSPSFPGDEQAQSTQEPQDQIDEAAMESFPASDPPASYRRA